MKRLAKYIIKNLILIFFLGLLVYIFLNTSCKDRDREKLIYINQDDSSFRNSYNPKEHISFFLDKDQSLLLKARTERDHDHYMFGLWERGKDEPLVKKEGRLKDGQLEDYLDLDLDLGDYELRFFYGRELRDSKSSYINYRLESKTKLRRGSGYCFLKGDMYNYNLDKLKKNNSVKRKYLSLLKYSKEERAKYQEILQEIFKNKGRLTDYERAFLISQYVSENIYYDYDALESGRLDEGRSYDTLKNKRAVCKGYSALTEALLRTAGIASRQTVGYGLEDGNWRQAGQESNHIWNEVYIDGRWISLDSTWNSRNRYQGGSFIKEDSLQTYFDPSLEAFSQKYRIDKRL